jgi:hypothetical protein
MELQTIAACVGFRTLPVPALLLDRCFNWPSNRDAACAEKQ